MFFFHIFLPYCHFSEYSRAYLRGGGSNPPPRNFQIFFLKSEGKEVGRKREKKMKRDGEGGG